MGRLIERLAFEKGINYQYSIKDDVNIIGNADEIRQFLTILIDNAIKNTNYGGSIDYECTDILNLKENILSFSFIFPLLHTFNFVL